MNVEQIVSYVAGYVGAEGGKVELRTTDIDRALDWTRSHTSDSELAVCVAVTLDDHNCNLQHDGYIAEHMNENIIGFGGTYTKQFIRDLGEIYGS